MGDGWLAWLRSALIFAVTIAASVLCESKAAPFVAGFVFVVAWTIGVLEGKRIYG